MSVSKEELESLSSESPTGKFALGLYETLAPAVAQCDETIRAVVNSQRGVVESIDRLSNGEFDFFSCSWAGGTIARKYNDCQGRRHSALSVPLHPHPPRTPKRNFRTALR